MLLPLTHLVCREVLGLRYHSLAMAQLLVGWPPYMPENFGPLDELVGRLLETWGNRYDFECDRKRRVARFTRGEMIATVDELPAGKLQVTYQHAPKQDTSEVCTPAEAAAFVEAILFRKHLCKLPKPSQKTWWQKIFGL